MDWKQVKKYPLYNPYTFQLARHIRGWTKSDLSKKSKLAVGRISQIENGDDLPTIDEIERISCQNALAFPISFFQQWHETTLEFNGCIAKSIPIDYYKYKIFRDINPVPLGIIRKETSIPVKEIPVVSIFAAPSERLP